MILGFPATNWYRGWDIPGTVLLAQFTPFSSLISFGFSIGYAAVP